MPDEAPDPKSRHLAAPSAKGSTAPTVSRSTDALDELGSSEDPEDLIGLVVGERYRLIELVGKGGMGTVYRAEHVHIRKSFALKVLHRELTHHAEAVKRFEREAIAAGRIEHPNVATAIDFGKLPNGAFYLVLEYVQGRTLRQLLTAEKRLPIARAVHIARQIASALASAHGAGVVHRDLKPDNVMLVESSVEADWIKVLDFGVAKLRTEDVPEETAITRFGTVFGTPEYMSPEQALGQAVDASSDLYALGIMIYEMLIGRTPFADSQLVNVLSRQITEQPAPLPGTVLPALRQLVLQLLEKQPSARPASAELVVERLDELIPQMHSLVDRDSESALDDRSARSVASIGESETVLRAARGPGESLASASTLPAPAPGLVQYWQRARSWLEAKTPRKLEIAGHRVSRRTAMLIAAGALGTLLIVSVTRARHPRSAAMPQPSIATEQPREDRAAKELQLLIEQARRGDFAALQRLEQRSDSERGASEWFALGAGRARAKQWTESLRAYERAVVLGPGYATDSQLLADVFNAALDPQSSVAAMDLASNHLGAAGFDLLYALGEASSSGRVPRVDLRKAKVLVDSEQASSLLTPALRVTLRVGKARGCQELKSVLPEIESSGDQRTHRVLQRKLSASRGCGFLGLGDCYGCVRGSKALNRASEATKARSGPSFPEIPADPPARNLAR